MAEVSKEEVLEALREVYDPEIPLVNVVDLGLIYEVKVDDGKVFIKMTLTNPLCPLANLLPEMVKEAVKKLKGVKEVKVELVWDPPWSPDKMSKEAERVLGLK